MQKLSLNLIGTKNEKGLVLYYTAEILKNPDGRKFTYNKLNGKKEGDC